LNTPADINNSLDPMAHLPAVSSPVRITTSFQMHAHSEVSNDTLTILHFVLSGTPNAGTPAKVLASYMSSFLSESTLQFEEVEFDFTDPADIEPHAKRVAELYRQFQYVLFIANSLSYLLI
jgi:hypothetical protein